MFNFTTLTVYNNIKDLKFTSKDSGRRVEKDVNLVFGYTSDKPTLRIGNTRFNKDDILDVQIKTPTDTSLAEVTFDLASIESIENIKMARIVLYVGLSMNCQDAFYANEYVYKGKPLFIEFPITGTAATDVAKLKKIADKYLLFTMGTERILDVIDNGDGTVTFKGVNGYLQIKKAVLQRWDPEAETVDCCTTSGDYIDVITGVPLVWKIDTDPSNTETYGKAIAVKVTVNEGLDNEADVEQKYTETGPENLDGDTEVGILPGLEAFGDYNWIIHNLRLPTAANYYPWSPANRMGEMPIPGQKYTQFIIRMIKERDGIMGEIVGARGTSVTTHVLYVAGNCALDDSVTTTPADVVYKYLTAELGLATTGATLKVFTDADDKLVEPFEDVA